MKTYINALDYSTCKVTYEDNPRKDFRRAIDLVYKLAIDNPEKLIEATEALKKVCNVL